jgi:hypothetical protein
MLCGTRKTRRAGFGAILAAFWIMGLGACVSTPVRNRFDAVDALHREVNAAEDINGSFPDVVYIKTRTQTFNSYHYYILKDGLIWHKGIKGEPQEWTIFRETGLPHNSAEKNFQAPKYIVEISADADELVALSDEGRFYRFCFEWILLRPTNQWVDLQGFPTSEGLYMDRRVAKNRAWALGKRNDQVKYYEDPFGNQHHNGTQEIATTYVLLEDGQEICYADTGLPCDFSRNFLGPERGTFKASALSAGGSTIFLINDAGEMYTRIADFDITGCDPMLFKYTYVPYTSNLTGYDYGSNLTPWALPPEDWRPQPAIPLEGKAAITRHITILQNGQGNAARELRVAGYNPRGETGYWSKPIFAPAWEFVPAPLFFGPGIGPPAAIAAIEDPSEGVPDPPQEKPLGGLGDRGPSLDVDMRGYRWVGNAPEAEWEYAVSGFNILEGSCSLHISWRGETCTVTLHPVEIWTYIRRDYLPGRTGPPKLYFVTLDIGENALEGRSEEFRARIKERFAAHDKVLFHYTMEANTNYMILWDGSDGILVLSRETFEDDFWEHRYSWFFEGYEEIARYHSPELRLPEQAVYTREHYAEIWRRIEPNRRFKRELEARITEYAAMKKAAFNFNMVYTTLDFIGQISLLNFIDIPKIYTITRFGKRILKVNRTYTDLISDMRIWIDRNLIDLLDIRIKSYTLIAERIARGAPEAVLPAGFGENARGYWKIAALPVELAGTFNEGADALPAFLSSELLDQGFFGWILRIGEVPLFSFTVEIEDSPRIIYERNGKPAEAAPYHFRGTLSINMVSSQNEGRSYYNKTIAPFLGGGKRLKVDMRFDGKELLITYKRFLRRDIVIFRGNV